MFTLTKQDGPIVQFSATGHITKQDYEVLTPAVQAAIDAHGYANLLVVAKDLKSETWDALRKDAEFGFGPYKDIRKFALVTDQKLLEVAVHIMAPFTPAVERVFAPGEEAAAEAWLAT